MNVFSSLHDYSDLGVLALRAAVAAIFLVHGLSKRSMWKMQPGERMSAGMLRLMRLLSVVEPLGAIAVLTGFLTQLAAVGLGIIMIGAMNMKIRKWKMPFSALDKTGWELDLLLFACCAALLFGGAGAFSLDRAFFAL